MPQGLGMFAQNWTLLTEVCDSCNKYGSSQRSVQFWSVSMANKSSIVSDLHG